MTGSDASEHQRPLTYLRGYPVYASTALVAAYVAALLLGVALGTAGMGGIFHALGFSSADVLQSGRVWQLFTYPLVNRPGFGLLWFVLEMFLLHRFGREIELVLGRPAFLRLYLLLILAAPGVLSLLALAAPDSGPRALSGSSNLHFSLFLAFATLYPGMPTFFGLTARWLAAILMTVYTLQEIAAGQYAFALALWCSAAVAVAFVAHQRGSFNLPNWTAWRPWRSTPKFRVVRDPWDVSEAGPEGAGEEVLRSIDPLLEKISRTGLSSLTQKERDQLEAARETLIRKDGEHPH